MSATQTTLSIDKNTKLLADARAKDENIPLSTIVKILLRDYAEGKLNIGIRETPRDENGFTLKQAQELEKTLKDLKKSNNLSPEFSNMRKAIDWLDNN